VRSCEDFERLLPAYVAGVAAPDDVADIGEHIAECAPCMNDLQRVIRDLGSLKLWREPGVPDGLAARILERLAGEEERRRREAIGEGAALAEPVHRLLAFGALLMTALVVGALLITAYAGSRYQEKVRTCAENLRQMGIAVRAEHELKAPLGPALESLRKPLDEKHFICPVKGEPASGKKHSYLLELRGPRYLAGDWRENHGYRDANILMSDGSVVLVTERQASIWQLLDPQSKGR
jgi:hypothetical protein